MGAGTSLRTRTKRVRKMPWKAQLVLYFSAMNSTPCGNCARAPTSQRFPADRPDRHSLCLGRARGLCRRKTCKRGSRQSAGSCYSRQTLCLSLTLSRRTLPVRSLSPRSPNDLVEADRDGRFMYYARLLASLKELSYRQTSQARPLYLS